VIYLYAYIKSTKPESYGFFALLILNRHIAHMKCNEAMTMVHPKVTNFLGKNGVLNAKCYLV